MTYAPPVKKHPNITIFLDLDGVMADFDKHARDHGKYTETGEVKWEELDYKWWVTIPPCEGAKDFYRHANETGWVRFLTTPVLSEDCFSGKANWVQHFEDRGRYGLHDLIICPSRDKYFMARPNHILIDDRKKNIDDWVAAGGIGIHHTGDFVQTKQLFDAAVESIAASAKPQTAFKKHAPKP